MKTLTTGSAVAALLVLTAGASADPIIDIVGSPSNGSTVRATQYNMIQFSLTSAFEDVDIDASLITTFTSMQSGTAYLTNMAGAGTTAANEIAQVNFNFVNVPSAVGNVGWVDLFSGLDLAAGTYHLVLTSASSEGGSISLNPAATFTTDPDATVDGMFFASAGIDAGYAPASTWTGSGLGNRFFRVSGTKVPAPAGAAVLGLAGLAAARRRR